MQDGMPLSLGIILGAAILGVVLAAGFVVLAVFTAI